MENMNSPDPDVIDVSDRAFRNRCDITECVAFLDGVDEESNQQFDAMKVIDTLLKENIISCYAYNKLKKMFEDGDSFMRILTKLSRYCSLSSLIYTLYNCNYTRLAERMDRHRHGRDSPIDATSDVVEKIEGCPHSALQLYVGLKRNIDNSAFIDNREFLRIKAQHLCNELEKLNVASTRRKACLLDKLLVVKCTSVEVTTDLCARFEVLRQIETDKNFENSRKAEAVLCSKEASTLALQGDFVNAEELMFRARLILANFSPSWLVYYHYMNEVFLKIAEYEEQPSNELKQGLLFYGFSGLRAVAKEDDNTQRFWKRIYISFMLYGLLGLGLFLNEISVNTTAEDRKLARNLLSEFNRLSEGMETRRDMLYAFFMSKLHEDDDVELALTYASRAMTLSADGVLRNGEAENVSIFVSKLRDKLRSFTDKAIP